MNISFWIIFIICCIVAIVDLWRTRSVDVWVLLILALFFIVGAASFGWPG